MSFLLIFPVDVVVDTLRPRFGWAPMADASAYRVTVFTERFKTVAMSEWQPVRHWTLNRPLERGESYVWQVTARVGHRDIVAPSPPHPEARFKVTSEDQSAQLAELRRRAGDSH